MAVRAFFPDQNRDAEARVLDGIALNSIHGIRTLARGQSAGQRHSGPRIGAKHAVQRADACLGHLAFKVFRKRNCSIFMFIDLPAEGLNQLRGLFFQGHQSQ
ncbi:hypothetical protein D3C81_1880560 [compost metagenome]